MKSLNIKTSDDQTFNVDWDVAIQSETIRSMLDDLAIDEDTITLPNKEITGPILLKALEWCGYFKDDDIWSKRQEFTSNDDLFDDWEKDYLNMPFSIVRPLMITADLLEIKGLTNLMTGLSTR